MSRFQHQQQGLAWAIAQIENIKARLSRISTPGGQLRIESTTIVGGIWPHDHSNAEGAGKVEYAPAIASNWNGSTDPGNIWQALDQLAARIKAFENLYIVPTASAANTMLFNGME